MKTCAHCSDVALPQVLTMILRLRLVHVGDAGFDAASKKKFMPHHSPAMEANALQPDPTPVPGGVTAGDWSSLAPISPPIVGIWYPAGITF